VESFQTARLSSKKELQKRGYGMQAKTTTGAFTLGIRQQKNVIGFRNGLSTPRPCLGVLPWSEVAQYLVW